jgi:parvulin-like peptidyl-prolyl isomerase
MRCSLPNALRASLPLLTLACLWSCASTPPTPTFARLGAEAAPAGGAPAAPAPEGAALAPAAGAAAAPGAAAAGSNPAAAAPAGGSAPSGAARPTAADPAEIVLARVGDGALTLGELMQALYYREGDALRSQFNLAIGAELANLEAGRLGLQVDPGLLERRAAEVLGEFARKNVPEGESLDRFLSERLGFEPLRFKNRLRQDSLRELITERVVRAHSLCSEHVDIRVLVADQATVEKAQERLAAGEDFLALISELSRDPSARDGGRVAYLVRDDRAPLARLAFKTPVGEIGGPLRLPGDPEGAPTLLLRVDARPEPLSGNWRELGPAVEAALADVPVSEEEYIAWQVAMERRYVLELEPFYALLGQAQARP